MSCSEYTTCEDCSASSCHWCGDSLNGACYSKYNYFACVWSTPCEQLEKCLRKHPEFIGNGSRTLYINQGVLFLTIWCLVFIPFLFRSRIWKRKSTGNDTVESKAACKPETETLGDEESLQELLLPKTRAEELSMQDDLSLNEESSNKDEAVHERGMPRSTKEASRKAEELRLGCCLSLLNLLCYLVALLLLLSVFLFIYISPQAPDFSVCTSELDWGSMIDSITNFKYTVQGDFILQASIYNPNRFDMSLKNCDGSFVYKDQLIGTFSVDWKHSLIPGTAERLPGPLTSDAKRGLVADLGADDLKDIIVPSGSVFDVLFVVKLDVPASLAYDIYEDYHVKHDVIMTVVTAARVGIRVSNNMVYNMNYTLPPVEMSILNLEDKRCKCKLKRP